MPFFTHNILHLKTFWNLYPPTLSNCLDEFSASAICSSLSFADLSCMDNTAVKTFWLNSAVKNVRFNCPPHSKVEYDFISLLPVSIWENPTGFQRIRGIKGTVMSDKDVCWLSCFSGMVFFCLLVSLVQNKSWSLTFIFYILYHPFII